MPNQKPMWTMCLGGFSVMWVTKLLIFPVEIRIFCPKTTKFGPKLAFLVNLGQAMQAYSMPCCGSVGGCGARAVSRKTPIYFIIFYETWNISGWNGSQIKDFYEDFHVSLFWTKSLSPARSKKSLGADLPPPHPPGVMRYKICWVK